MTRSCGLFVTGTDTNVGKTVVSVAVLRALVASGYRAIGMKPVAAGLPPGIDIPVDVTALAAAGNVDASLADRSPYIFAPAIAPHLAAAQVGVAIELDTIRAAYARLAACADMVVVEGAGGALVPLDEWNDMLDIPLTLALPVVLVVGMRLGCLNHALLTSSAIRARGLRLVGWVANRIEAAMEEADANVTDLERRLGAPLLADIPHGQAASLATTALDKLGIRRWLRGE
ncbi:MAG: dethiobiotin synthase [Casimicrobiaceae bacterium]